MLRKTIKTLLLIGALTISSHASDSLFLKQFFNNNKCDQVLNNNGYFKTCYDYKLKSAKYVAYTLEKDKVNAVNIKKRPRFYEDLHIPKRYRSKYSDYTHSGYDRGHNCPDADRDNTQRSLKSTYSMSNIVAQEPSINRSKRAWAGLEKFERNVAVKLGDVNVLIGNVYSAKPKRIGHNQIAVPEAFWKMIYNKEKNYERCFYFENKPVVNKKKKIKDYEVECRKLVR